MSTKFIGCLTAVLLGCWAVSAYGQSDSGSTGRTLGKPLTPRASRTSNALLRGDNGEFMGRATTTPASGRFGARTLGQPLGPKTRPAATGIDRNPSGELVGRATDRTMFPQSARRKTTAADIAPLPAGFVVEPAPQVVTPTEVYVVPFQLAPPAQEPPATEPPAEQTLPPELPPAEQPPAEQPPAEQPAEPPTPTPESP